MKNYFFVQVHDWATNDIDCLEVLSAIEDPKAFLKPSADFVMSENEKFYFLPGVSVPRIKLKDLYANTKSKTVREIDDATKIITGGKTLDKLFEQRWLYSLDTSTFKAVLKILQDDNCIDDDKYTDIMDALEIYTEDKVLGGIDLMKLCQNINLNNKLFTINSTPYYILDPEYPELDTPSNLAKLCDESFLIELANGEESTTIDRKMYETLSEMFESDDTDNRVLAMEIMANSNYKESLLYLCFLFEEYSKYISDIRSRNHVNFKSLSNYMGFSSPSYCSMNKDDIIRLLIERDVFTKEMGIELLTKYKREVEDFGDSTYFRIAKITFDDPVINYLKEKNNVTNPE